MRSPRLRPLTIPQARASLANRLTRAVDNARQIATRLGARPYRVVLVWTRWAGRNVERGEGREVTVREIEILPTPKISSLDGVSFSIFHAGTVPEGSIKLTEVSTSYTFDELSGHMIPGRHEDQIPQPFEFFYELREDGRGDPKPGRQKYRLLSFPTLDAENAQWTLMLQRISEDRDREGRSRYESGTQG